MKFSENNNYEVFITKFAIIFVLKPKKELHVFKVVSSGTFHLNFLRHCLVQWCQAFLLTDEPIETQN